MRKTHSSLALLLAVILLIGPQFTNTVSGEETDFDDGVVESVQDDEPALATDENGEELVYESPKYDPMDFHFVDHFDDTEKSQKLWVKSQAKKDDIAEEIAKYDGVWSWEAPQRIVWKNDIGLVLKSKAKHAAIAAKLFKPFTFEDDKPLIVQYEVTLQEGQECGGSYIKLLSANKANDDLTKFNDKTPYTIMFGPDKCGNDIKMHFIFRHVNPINGSITEKHCRKPKDRLEEPFKDKLPHLYTLILRPDNTFEIRLDHNIVNEGSLLSEFTPPVNPPREIDDPNDKKPDDWDEREKIPDPAAQKPEDWDDDAPPQIPDPSAVMPNDWLEDEPEMIPDPSALKPDDWDVDMDGEWEAPLVDNPVCEKVSGCGKWKAPLIANKDYKGKWRAPMIDNPNYRGKWAARKIPNPEFFEDLAPFKMTPISAVGIELWSMSNEILFDNLIITDDLDVAIDYSSKTFDLKRKFIAKESDTFLNKVMTYGKENPWSWRIALVLLVTPLAFSFYRLVRGGKKDTTADAKKTDAVQPDDDQTAADDDNKQEAGTKSSPKKKKSDLDVKNSAGDAEPDEEDSGKDSTEDVDGGASEEKETEESTSTKPRKRRVRKDAS
ncbi:calnexin isoform X2 [Stomoxys calcitrans]|uniref:Calnexin n=1 Tax=Stomoxys calcitrans TaxID=35570 RepID=A0A1I8PTS3_STOCA|nr:calnexin isoform X2 [Stomoxys calcitrans]